MFDAADLDVRPMAGWHEFQAARQRVADQMWIDSQLHQIVHGVRTASDASEASAQCQLHDETN